MILSKHNIKRSFLICALLLVPLAGCATSQKYLPQNVSPQIQEEALEAAYGVELKMRTKYELVSDHGLLKRINTLTEELREYSLFPQRHTHTYIVKNSFYVNAATGGKDIFFGERLIHELRTDERIAFVLAHELSHIDRFHGLRTYKAQKRKKWYTLGATQAMNVGLSFIPGLSASPVLGILVPQSVSIFNNMASNIMHKGYQRSFEYEADRDAVNILVKAGYEPTVAIDALEVLLKLEKAQKNSGLKIETLSTHPLLEKRIKRLNEYLVERAQKV